MIRIEYFRRQTGLLDWSVLRTREIKIKNNTFHVNCNKNARQIEINEEQRHPTSPLWDILYVKHVLNDQLLFRGIKWCVTSIAGRGISIEN